MNAPLRVALLTTDSRDHFKTYDDPRPAFGAAPEALLEGFAQMPELEVDVISCARRPLADAQLAPNIRTHALFVPKLGWLSTGYQGCIRAVRRKLRELRPDLVHGQGTERDCAIAAVMSGFPNVVTIHGNMAELARRFDARALSHAWLTAKVEDFTLPRTSGVFCNSAYTEALVRPRARRTWRVANALRLPFFGPLPGAARAEPTRIVNVGIVSRRKRQLELLAVARRLHECGSRFVLEFVGGCAGADEYQRAFAARVAEAERAGFARWCGEKSAEELIAHLDRAAGALHFPSEEAFGLVVAEALARNLKFFGARVGGVEDIAAGCEGAELFAADDWSALEEAIRRWLDAGAPRPLAAAPEMAARYHPRVIAARHVQIYREVLSSEA